MTPGVFRKRVHAYYTVHGRHDLPWRLTRDPYAILVSEIMLQQTQVDRVIPYFKGWLKKFPTIRTLARASLLEVLAEWQGLGYNRRGKLLRECAKEIVEKYEGIIPKDVAALVSLPAIGPYTAGAIRAFAFDMPEVFIETNIRAALIHDFFPQAKKIPDSELIPILKKLLLHTKSPREWYSALMDYGAHIKKKYPNPSRRSKHHTRQSGFEGSIRQKRGIIMRQLLTKKISNNFFKKYSSKELYRFEQALRSLEADGLIVRKGKMWHLAS